MSNHNPFPNSNYKGFEFSNADMTGAKFSSVNLSNSQFWVVLKISFKNL